MKAQLEQLLLQTLQKIRETESWSIELPKNVQIDRPRDTQHGDYACNVAMILAKSLKTNPRQIAQLLIDSIPETPYIEKIEIAGPGFINFFLTNATFQHIIPTILQNKTQYGHADIGEQKRVIVEFVSANPTGPLHIGHGRGAAYGAVISNLLSTVGYRVHREYYVNDAGRQMDILAVSVWLRYLELNDTALTFPSNGYKGGYVYDIAHDLQKQYGEQFNQPIETVYNNIPPDETDGGDKEAHIDALIDKAKTLLKTDYETIHKFGTDAILKDIKNDLEEFGVHFDEWFSEKSLTKKDAINHALDALREKNYIYTKEGATWFASTQFGDEKDRVLIRANGQTTYFASDIAYHWNKLQRGFDIIIDVLGADHHGYVPRVLAALQALGLNADALHVPLVQFAILYRDGKRVPMSTRSGEFITIRELREEIGNDAARFFYIMRKAEHHMDFDLDLAKSKSNENPVFYIQYAHARICSVFRQLEEKGLSWDATLGCSSLNQLTTKAEKTLLMVLSQYSETIITAAKNLEPHLLANYLRDLAHAFHTYYNTEQFILENDALRNARLCLTKATQQIIQNGLQLLGVSAPEQM